MSLNLSLNLMLFLVGCSFTDQFLLLSGWYLKHPQLANWSVAFPLAYGPLLWFYTVALLKPEGWEFVNRLFIRCHSLFFPYKF